MNSVTAAFLDYGWTVLGSENVRLVDPNESYLEVIAEAIERAKPDPKACIFATLHYYPSKPD